MIPLFIWSHPWKSLVPFKKSLITLYPLQVDFLKQVSLVGFPSGQALSPARSRSLFRFLCQCIFSSRVLFSIISLMRVLLMISSWHRFLSLYADMDLITGSMLIRNFRVPCQHGFYFGFHVNAGFILSSMLIRVLFWVPCQHEFSFRFYVNVVSLSGFITMWFWFWVSYQYGFYFWSYYNTGYILSSISMRVSFWVPNTGFILGSM